MGQNLWQEEEKLREVSTKFFRTDTDSFHKGEKT